jgi:hypothetical protein
VRFRIKAHLAIKLFTNYYAFYWELSCIKIIVMEIAILQCISFDSSLMGCSERSKEPTGSEKWWGFFFCGGEGKLSSC